MFLSNTVPAFLTCIYTHQRTTSQRGHPLQHNRCHPIISPRCFQTLPHAVNRLKLCEIGRSTKMYHVLMSHCTHTCHSIDNLHYLHDLYMQVRTCIANQLPYTCSLTKNYTHIASESPCAHEVRGYSHTKTHYMVQLTSTTTARTHMQHTVSCAHTYVYCVYE